MSTKKPKPKSEEEKAVFVSDSLLRRLMAEKKRMTSPPDKPVKSA